MTTLKAHRNAVYAREERQYLQKLLERTNGRIGETCQIAGLNRARLYQLIHKHRLDIPKSSGNTSPESMCPPPGFRGAEDPPSPLQSPKE
jgi:hypothetical protein